MSTEKASGTIPIVVALIGLAGSLAVAWITTGAKFDRELYGKANELSQLRKNLEDVELKLRQQQQEAEKKLAEVDERSRKLEAQIDVAKAAVEKLMKTGIGLIGTKKN